MKDHLVILFENTSILSSVYIHLTCWKALEIPGCSCLLNSTSVKVDQWSFILFFQGPTCYLNYGADHFALTEEVKSKNVSSEKVQSHVPTSLFNLSERNANDACQRKRERLLERKNKRMKCEDDMQAGGKGHCLTEKWFKRYIMGRERALLVKKELAFLLLVMC